MVKYKAHGAEPGMKAIDEPIVRCLDQVWRTLPQIRTLLGSASSDTELTSSLRRLAKAGLIEQKRLETGAPRLRRGNKFLGTREIELYRLVMPKADRRR
jgi:hypothetical protein